MDDDQLIKTIDQVYFQHEKDFNLDYLTQQLPDNLSSDYLLDYKDKFDRLLRAVTRKVSELVLSHQPAYVGELERIADLQKSITESIRVCTHGRSCLKFIKDGTAQNGSTIIRHCQKRESLTKLLESLLAINNLRKSVIEIKNLIDTLDDFPRAIQMCKDGKSSLESFNKFQCVNDLGTKLIDTVLAKMCVTNDPETYMKLHTAYVLMDQNEIANSQALNFFNAYHSSSVEELKMFLENELWEVVPVKNDFRLVHLKEFSFLRTAAAVATNNPIPKDPNELVNILAQDIFAADDENDDQNRLDYDVIEAENRLENVFSHATTKEDSLFPNDVSSQHHHHHQQQHGSYFDQPDALPLDKISLSSDSEIDSELEKEFVDEDEVLSKSPPPNYNNKISHTGPVVTNSSLHVLRLAGRYVQMMNVLSPISFEILMKIYELLDHYTAFVYKKFGPDDDTKLSSVISSLRESLIGNQSSNLEEACNMINEQGPATTTTDNRHDQSRDHSKKSIAIESLIFLVNQLWNLQEYLESLISADQRAQLREQFSQNHSMIPDFLKARAEIQLDCNR